MKKFFATICAATLLMTGCGGDSNPKPAQDEGKATIGIITHLNVSEDNYNKLMQKLEKSYRPSKAHLSADYKYFDNMKELQLALSAEQIDMIGTYQCVSDYMVNRNPNMEILKSERVLSDSFCFAVREGDTRLKNNLNKAIKSMQEDGTLANLSNTYITELKGDAEPPAVAIEHIPDTETIKVAVTGDLPPLDLVLADGTPAGFSTAVLAEISKRIGKNIEIINI
ncbi:MAG: transporter substrate-binding domain-containing protein, partial [Selenomonadaceae bacterium]|nr:transporter substrate-binding domain-containing protein [Selenomonadaceae bacterium]